MAATNVDAGTPERSAGAAGSSSARPGALPGGEGEGLLATCGEAPAPPAGVAPVAHRPRHVGPQRRVRAAISTDRATVGLTVARLVVAPRHVVFVKGVLEASDGLACLFADRGGELRIASPVDRAAELREVLTDLSAELGGTLEIEAPRDQGAHQAPPPPR